MALYKLTEYRFTKLIPLDTIYDAGVEGRAKALKIINRQYCKAMVLRGACTQKCEDCKETLTKVFTGMDPKATNPWGLFTYRVRSANMSMIEHKTSCDKSAPLSDDGNSFFDEKVDPLDALEKMLQ